MSVKNKNSYCGAWQMFSAANVLMCTIRSVYPNLGEKPVQHMLNREFQPAVPGPKKMEALMWTSARTDLPDAFWIANHVVPLLQLQQAQNIDQSFEATSVLNTGFCKISCTGPSDADTSLFDSGFYEHLDPCVPIVDDFYEMCWSDGKHYLCQVKAFDSEQRLAHVNFMKQVGNLYTWPSNPDSSWEPAGLLKGPIRLTIDETYSTQRKLMFSVIE